MLAFLAHLVGWIGLGSHALVPPWLARAADRRRVWAIAALPLALAAGVVELRRLAARPDDLFAAAGLGAAPVVLRVAGVAWLALLVADALLLVGWRRLEPVGWRVLGGFGAVALAVWSTLEELLRVGSGPPVTALGLLAAAACRGLVGCAAGEALLPRRPWWALVGAPALAAHALLLPAPLTTALLAGGWMATLVAATVAFGVAPWAPLRLRRPAAVAGILLAALWFAGIATVAASLPLASAGTPAMLPR